MRRDELLQGKIVENKQGIALFRKSKDEALDLAADLLYKASDFKTCIFLSGGTTPKPLYEQLSLEAKLKAGAIAMVDERYGVKLHDKSNEKMITETYLTNLVPSFYSILEDLDEENQTIEQTAFDYDETLRYLFNYFPKTIGILGIGDDGHTAGIPAIRDLAKEIEEDKSSYARHFDDEGKYGPRITMTFNSLIRLDLIIILMFGKEKKEAYKKMFSDGDVSDIPARIYIKEEVCKKVVLFTDI